MSVKQNRNFKDLTYALKKRQQSRPDVSGSQEDGSGVGDAEMADRGSVLSEECVSDSHTVAHCRTSPKERSPNRVQMI